MAALVTADKVPVVAEAELYVANPQMLDMVLAAAQTFTYGDRTSRSSGRSTRPPFR